MKNLWKGFVIGSVAGAAIGLIVDGGAKAGQRLSQAASDVDLSAKASELRDRAAKSDAVHTASDRAHEAVRTGAGVLSQAKDAVTDLAANHSPSS